MNCERCCNELPAIDVTPFGSAEPVYVYGDCHCPRPRCPFCMSALLTGKCMNVDCFMCLCLIPVPVMAP